jgi:hypothetical protein
VAVAGPADGPRHMAAKVAPRFALGCLDDALAAFSARCYNFGRDDYALEFAKSFTSMCESGIKAETITAAIEATCPHLLLLND